MPHSTTPDSHALPEPVLRFAEQDAGLFVFAGGPEAVTAAAEALATHVEGATGRQAEHRAPQHLAQSGPRLLVDDRPRMDVDRLIELVAEAEAGALVIATMADVGTHPYVHLVDIIRLGEDIDYRFALDRALCAVARVQRGGTATDVYLGDRQPRRR